MSCSGSPVKQGGRGALVAALVLILGGGAWFALSRRDPVGPGGRPVATGPRPNIVLIVWDTCRGDRVAVHGYKHATTPVLSEFAKKGVTFHNCFTPSPFTPPAHASLFTGLLPRRHGLREQPAPTLAPGIPLLAETLKANGYDTAAVTANPSISQVTNLLQGFQSAAVLRKPETGKGDSDQAIAWVEDWARNRKARPGADRPVFLFVNLMETHLPFRFRDEDVAALRGRDAVTAALAEASRVTGVQSLGHLLGVRTVRPEILEALNAAYDGSIVSSDRATGAILATLEREGILEGALTIVTSDHGENLGEHGELEHRMSVYEPVLRVPLVVSWPGKFDGGRSVDAQVRLQDLYPTMLEAARVPVPPPCGKDATSLLEDPIRPRTAIAQYGPTSGFLKDARGFFPEAREDALRRLHFEWLAVREPPTAAGSRKYIAVSFHPDGGAPRLEWEELYDLAADPGEKRNLLGPGAGPAEREAVDRLRRHLK